MVIVILILTRKCIGTYSAKNIVGVCTVRKKVLLGLLVQLLFFRFRLFHTYKLVILVILFKGAKKPQNKLISRGLLGLLVQLVGTFGATYWDFWFGG